jgi:hypothetical protein
MAALNLRLSDELLAEVDTARGDVPRTKWLVRVIEERLGLAEMPSANDDFDEDAPAPTPAQRAQATRQEHRRRAEAVQAQQLALATQRRAERGRQQVTPRPK